LRFKKALPLSEILSLVEPLVQAKLYCPAGKRVPEHIKSLDSPPFSSDGSLTFIQRNAPASLFRNTEAAFAISEQSLVKVTYPYLVVSSIYESIRLIVLSCRDRFVRPAKRRNHGKIHPTAVVEGSVEKDARIGAGCYIGRHSIIGQGTVLSPHVTVLENCVIGSGCEIQPGAVIGSSGFGFYEFNNNVVHMPHLAGVKIGNNVWIGANTVIAAGVLNPTFVGDNCKLDSHLQIAHNVWLGEDGMLASQSGIAGSTRVGSRFRMGGASSVSGHLVLGNDVVVAARTGVTKNLSDKAVVAGFPARPLLDWKKQQIYLRRIAGQRKTFLR
jgi:UDP-3-O-[3-hydroxymyristoyl] glucosamine N-acyltransferase LpxD